MPGSLLLTDVVLAEAVWTLKSAFEQGKHAQSLAVRSLLEETAFAFEDRETVAAALGPFRSRLLRIRRMPGRCQARSAGLRIHRDLRSRHAQAARSQDALTGLAQARDTEFTLQRLRTRCRHVPAPECVGPAAANSASDCSRAPRPHTQQARPIRGPSGTCAVPAIGRESARCVYRPDGRGRRHAVLRSTACTRCSPRSWGLLSGRE